MGEEELTGPEMVERVEAELEELEEEDPEKVAELRESLTFARRAARDEESLKKQAEREQSRQLRFSESMDRVQDTKDPEEKLAHLAEAVELIVEDYT